MAKAVRPSSPTSARKEKVAAAAPAPVKATAAKKEAAPKAAAKKEAAPKAAPARKTAVAKSAASPKAPATKPKPAAAVKKAAPKEKTTAKKAAASKKEKPAKTVPTPAKPAPLPSPELSSLPDHLRILITQPRPEGEKSPYFDLAKKYNLSLDFHPFILVEGLSGKEFRRQRVDLSEYTAIVFTSRLAVDHFFRIMEEMKMKVNQDLKYFCITEAVALYLQKFILYRKRKVFFSADGSTQGLLDVIGKHKAEKYVVPTADTTKKEIPAFMAKYKITFAEASLYRTVSNDLAPVLGENQYDMIVFFSPFSIQALLEHDPEFQQENVLFGAFGPTTTKAVEEAGLRLDIKAPAPNAPSMVSAMEQFFTEFTAVKQKAKKSRK